tara:strand:- start:39 stop:212 length:174 start_codon:yes stop_codon:yes gene_type:complete
MKNRPKQARLGRALATEQVGSLMVVGYEARLPPQDQGARATTPSALVEQIAGFRAGP